uniref:Uncharacterized protein n=1 Tax=Clastoptera arizonana TaxID=38151 RepID=A0A1B6CKR4_9HEMI
MRRKDESERYNFTSTDHDIDEKGININLIGVTSSNIEVFNRVEEENGKLYNVYEIYVPSKNIRNKWIPRDSSEEAVVNTEIQSSSGVNEIPSDKNYSTLALLDSRGRETLSSACSKSSIGTKTVFSNSANSSVIDDVESLNTSFSEYEKSVKISVKRVSLKNEKQNLFIESDRYLKSSFSNKKHKLIVKDDVSNKSKNSTNSIYDSSNNSKKFSKSPVTYPTICVNTPQETSTIAYAYPADNKLQRLNSDVSFTENQNNSFETSSIPEEYSLTNNDTGNLVEAKSDTFEKEEIISEPKDIKSCKTLNDNGQNKNYLRVKQMQKNTEWINQKEDGVYCGGSKNISSSEDSEVSFEEIRKGSVTLRKEVTSKPKRYVSEKSKERYFPVKTSKKETVQSQARRNEITSDETESMSGEYSDDPDLKKLKSPDLNSSTKSGNGRLDERVSIFSNTYFDKNLSYLPDVNKVDDNRSSKITINSDAKYFDENIPYLARTEKQNQRQSFESYVDAVLPFIGTRKKTMDTMVQTSESIGGDFVGNVLKKKDGVVSIDYLKKYESESVSGYSVDKSLEHSSKRSGQSLNEPKNFERSPKSSKDLMDNGSYNNFNDSGKHFDKNMQSSAMDVLPVNIKNLEPLDNSYDKNNRNENSVNDFDNNLKYKSMLVRTDSLIDLRLLKRTRTSFNDRKKDAITVKKTSVSEDGSSIKTEKLSKSENRNSNVSSKSIKKYLPKDNLGLDLNTLNAFYFNSPNQTLFNKDKDEAALEIDSFDRNKLREVAGKPPGERQSESSTVPQGTKKSDGDRWVFMGNMQSRNPFRRKKKTPKKYLEKLDNISENINEEDVSKSILSTDSKGTKERSLDKGSLDLWNLEDRKNSKEINSEIVSQRDSQRGSILSTSIANGNENNLIDLEDINYSENNGERNSKRGNKLSAKYAESRKHSKKSSMVGNENEEKGVMTEGQYDQLDNQDDVWFGTLKSQTVEHGLTESLADQKESFTTSVINQDEIKSSKSDSIKKEKKKRSCVKKIKSKERPQLEMTGNVLLSSKPIPPHEPSQPGKDHICALTVKGSKVNGICNFYLDPRLEDMIYEKLDSMGERVLTDIYNKKKSKRKKYLKDSVT